MPKFEIHVSAKFLAVFLDDNTVAADVSDTANKIQMRVDYFALIDRLITELQERFPNKLQHFSPLQCKHMDMIDAESHLSKTRNNL